MKKPQLVHTQFMIHVIIVIGADLTIILTWMSCIGYVHCHVAASL
jgi:hypothetical protein